MKTFLLSIVLALAAAGAQAQTNTTATFTLTSDGSATTFSLRYCAPSDTNAATIAGIPLISYAQVATMPGTSRQLILTNFPGIATGKFAWRWFAIGDAGQEVASAALCTAGLPRPAPTAPIWGVAFISSTATSATFTVTVGP